MEETWRISPNIKWNFFESGPTERVLERCSIFHLGRRKGPDGGFVVFLPLCQKVQPKEV